MCGARVGAGGAVVVGVAVVQEVSSGSGLGARTLASRLKRGVAGYAIHLAKLTGCSLASCVQPGRYIGIPLASANVTSNPPWTHEELVLAVDLIDRRGWVGGNARTPELLELSSLLRAANFPKVDRIISSLRSPSSVSMKLGNLKGANPEVDGGLRATKREAEIVGHFLSNRDIMRALANSLRQIDDSVNKASELAPKLDEEEAAAAIEGGPRYVLAMRRERSAALRRAKVASAEAQGDRVACEVCDFSFQEAYGELGKSYVEVHHRTPLHVSGEVESSIEDLALLCANCHRMIHRRGWIGVEHLAAIYRLARINGRFDACSGGLSQARDANFVN